MIAVISDVHGNYAALKAVIEDISKRGICKIISLGDIAGYYCQINECIELCQQYDVQNILGNHDYYLISGNGCPRSQSANVCLQYQMNIIKTDNRSWLASSITKYDDLIMSLRHGGWNDPLDEYIYDFHFDLVSGYHQRIFASGHTHKQIIILGNDKIYFNPGSVGQPRDYDARAAYAIVRDDYAIELIRCEYPIEETIKAMKKVGFQDRISKCLEHGCKIGEYCDEKEDHDSWS